MDTQVGECSPRNCSGVDGLMLRGEADFLLTSVSYQLIDDFKSTFLVPASVPLGQTDMMIGTAGYKNAPNSTLVEVIEELRSIVNFPFIAWWCVSICTILMILYLVGSHEILPCIWQVLRIFLFQIYETSVKIAPRVIIVTIVIAFFFSISTIFNTMSTNRVSTLTPDLIDNLHQLAASGRPPIFSTLSHEYEQFRRAKSGPMSGIWSHRTSLSTVAINISNLFNLISKVLNEEYAFVAPSGTVAFVEVNACRRQIVQDAKNSINKVHTSKMPFASETHAMVIRKQNLTNIKFERDLMSRISKASLRSGSFGIGEVFTQNLINRRMPDISDADEYRISRCRENKQFNIQMQYTVDAVSIEYFRKFLVYLYGFVLIAWIIIVAEKVCYRFKRTGCRRQAWVD